MTNSFAPKASGARGQFLAIGNLELYYEESGAGNPLLLLHGFGGCTQNWQPFVEEFAKQYRVINVDFRGHGYSTNPDNTFTHREAANDIFLFLEKLNIDRFSAMGMSSGGMILLHMATQQPNRIDAMILLSTTTHFPEQARAIMRRASFATMPSEVRTMYRECAKRGDEQIEQLISQFNALSENDDDMNFTEQSLSGIKSRTLIVHGDRDQFFPSTVAENLHRSIPGSTLWLVPNGDHSFVFDAAIPFTSTVLRFLSSNKDKKA